MFIKIKLTAAAISQAKDGEGTGFLATGKELLNFSALCYTKEDLEEAKHLYELKKRDFVSFHIDHKHNGLGSASCGPAQLPPYELKPEAFDFTIGFRPFNVQDGNVKEMGKTLKAAL